MNLWIFGQRRGVHDDSSVLFNITELQPIGDSNAPEKPEEVKVFKLG
jgi:hypothetical protein